jgi:hypothetical protein
MRIEKFTLGMGDRFGHQGKSQLSAVIQANASGILLSPVWNKSNREHVLIGSHPDDLRVEADAAVQALNWKGSYYVDADHINLTSVDKFIRASNFFTIDVADYVGCEAEVAVIESFVKKHVSLTGTLWIPEITEPLIIHQEHCSRNLCASGASI